ncbi:hypothetical protein BJ170DRAFT_683530 [Xylariales sp. AK1849]|nr:hypothetical protein BJ170DRAFT_683530 [Xylariales sp. AK1849]
MELSDLHDNTRSATPTASREDITPNEVRGSSRAQGSAEAQEAVAYRNSPGQTDSVYESKKKYRWPSFTPNTLALTALVLALIFGTGSWVGMNYANSYAKKSYDLDLFSACHDYEDVKNTSFCRDVIASGIGNLNKAKRSIKLQPTEHNPPDRCSSFSVAGTSLLNFVILLAFAILVLPSLCVSGVLTISTIVAVRWLSSGLKTPEAGIVKKLLSTVSSLQHTIKHATQDYNIRLKPCGQMVESAAVLLALVFGVVTAVLSCWQAYMDYVSWTKEPGGL